MWIRSYDGAVLAELPIIRINVQAETAEEYISAAARRFGDEFFVPTNEELGDRVRIEAPFLGGSVGVHGEAIATPAIVDGRKGYYLRLIDLDRDSVMIMIPGPPDEAASRPALKIPKSRDTPPLPLPIVKPATPAPTAAEMKSITQTQPFRIAEKLPGVATAPPPGGAPLGAQEKPTEAAKADAAAKFEAAKAVMAAKSEGAKSEAAKSEAAKTETAKSEAAKTDAAKTDAKAEAKTDEAKTDATKTDAKSEATADAPKSDAKTDATKTDAKSEATADAPDTTKPSAAAMPATDSDTPTSTARPAVVESTETKPRPASPTNTEPTAPAMEPAAASVAAAKPVDSRRRVGIVIAASFAMVALTIFLITRRSPKPAATNVATVQQDAPLAPEPPPPVDKTPTEVPIIHPPGDEPKTTRVGAGGRNGGSADTTNARGSNAANTGATNASPGDNAASGSNTATSSGSNTATSAGPNTATSAGSNTATSAGSNSSPSAGSGATISGSNNSPSAGSGATSAGSSNATSAGSGATNAGSNVGSGTKAKPIAAPQSLSPRDSARITCKFGTEIELVWVAVPGATSYTVEVARDASFSSVAATIDADTTVGIFRPMAPGIFHWRVTAKTGSGRSEPSGSRHFTCTAD